MSEQNRDNFLTRWAQRKAEVAKAETPPADAAAPVEPAPESEPFDLASLPALDALTAETDVRPFMNALVPESLRNAALRRVWELDTAIRDYVSPATEYAWNWNETGGAQGYGPLEAGYKALQFAESMISDGKNDESLVVANQSVPKSEGSADAGAQSGQADNQIRDDGQSPPSAKPLVESGTVRLSTKSDADSNTNPASPAATGAEHDEAPQQEPAPKSYAALQHTAQRHGGATPR